MVQTLIKLVPHKVKWMVKFVQKWNLTPENLAREGCLTWQKCLTKKFAEIDQVGLSANTNRFLKTRKILFLCLFTFFFTVTTNTT